MIHMYMFAGVGLVSASFCLNARHRTGMDSGNTHTCRRRGLNASSHNNGDIYCLLFNDASAAKSDFHCRMVDIV